MSDREQQPMPKSEERTLTEQQEQSLGVLADWLNVYAEVYRQELSELAQLAYRETLKKVPANLLHAAFMRCLTQSKFLPVPAEILEAVKLEREEHPLPRLPEPEGEIIPMEELAELCKQQAEKRKMRY